MFYSVCLYMDLIFNSEPFGDGDVSPPSTLKVPPSTEVRAVFLCATQVMRRRPQKATRVKRLEGIVPLGCFAVVNVLSVEGPLATWRDMQPQRLRWQ